MFDVCSRVKNIMAKFGFPWFIAGGWATDLFLGSETREHEDIEIGIFRKDQMKFFRYFEKQPKHYIDNRGYGGKHEKKVWNKEYLRMPVHEVYVQFPDIEIEVLLDERDETSWVYRRNEKITHDMESAILYNEHGIPYLCPEIVCLYKTKNIREKDFEDIGKLVPRMKENQIQWLLNAIEETEIKEKIRNLAIG